MSKQLQSHSDDFLKHARHDSERSQSSQLFMDDEDAERAPMLSGGRKQRRNSYDHNGRGSRLRKLLVACFLTLAVIISGLAYLLVMSHPSAWLSQEEACKSLLAPASTMSSSEEKTVSASKNVTTRFRDALLPDERYITSFVIAGWTNDVISYGHLLQLAILTDRIPIVPPFAPSHIGRSAGLIPFSTVFDLPRLSALIHRPILEWSDIKNFTNPDPNPNDIAYNDYYGGEKEELGCWSLWMTQMGKGAMAREGMIPRSLSLEVSWTPVPWGHGVPRSVDLDYNIHNLAELGWKMGREKAVTEAKERYRDNVIAQLAKTKEDQKIGPVPEEIPVPNRLGKQIDPDSQLLCFDYLYYVATHESWEMWDESTPAWHLVGRHMHWSTHMASIAHEFLYNVFQTSMADGSPRPFIAVHIRRADFSGWCNDVPKLDCLAPLSAYARRVEEVRAEMRIEEGEEVPVVVMSDEPRVTPIGKAGYEEGESEAWWNEVHELGWKTIDHVAEQTRQKYGIWYESILDAVMLSMASGFVGTDRSTYSLLAKRRVEEWQKGPTRMVKWGNIGADDH